MDPHLATAIILIICGSVTLLTSRTIAAGMAKNLATHSDRPGRSKWLDPILSDVQVRLVLRVVALVFLSIGIYQLFVA